MVLLSPPSPESPASEMPEGKKAEGQGQEGTVEGTAGQGGDKGG